MWIIHFSPQIGRIGGICDEGNNWQQLANNYFIALLREAGNEVSICQKRSKMIQKKLFSLRAITRSSRRTKEMSAHGCARRDAIGRRRTRIESLETLPSGQVGRWDGGKAKQLMAVKIPPNGTTGIQCRDNRQSEKKIPHSMEERRMRRSRDFETSRYRDFERMSKWYS